MQPKTQITSDIVSHMATLANIPVTEKESTDLAKEFTKVLEVVDDLSAIDTSHVTPVGQVTGLENVTRPDEVKTDQMFSQEEALRNARSTHNGYFMVNQVLDR
jgi:aspartyl-tRNA(Asn)/glutamyl-tRNA(Gln) amidotransferase subunit C